MRGQGKYDLLNGGKNSRTCMCLDADSQRDGGCMRDDSGFVNR